MQWSKERAWEWYRRQPWLVGANFIPSTAVNQLEMWQADTFDLGTIERELGYANAIGMNTMRVFLHDLLWEQDPQAFLERAERYLEVASSKSIRTIFVLFDGVWRPNPKLGTQPSPIPHVHNSQWVQSPGKEILRNRASHGRLKNYVQGVIEAFAKDERVVMWDLYNEPDNPNLSLLFQFQAELFNKADVAFALLQKTFEWAREVDPTQPLTSAVWGKFFDSNINTFNVRHSDVLSFHSYANSGKMREQLDWLAQEGRPVVCTEYLSRPRNTLLECLPMMQELDVGALNWGLVSGKTQTIYPWRSYIWRPQAEPEVWFHDILRTDGSAFNEAEILLIQALAKPAN